MPQIEAILFGRILLLLLAMVSCSPTTAIGMQLFVKHNHGNTTTLEVERGDTFENLKQKIADRESDVASELLVGDLLLMDSYGVLYEDGSSLQDYNIQKEQTSFSGWGGHLTPVTGTDGNVIGNFNMQPHGDLAEENLTGAYFEVQLLMGADLTIANLTNANLGLVRLHNANLSGANLSGATLTGLAGRITGTTWTNSFYYTDNEPTWASGMDAAWRDSVGILAITPSAIPEPTTLLLALLALIAAPLRVR